MQGILENSEAYPLFLNAYQAGDTNRRNAERMAARLKEQRLAGDTRRLEEICRDVLGAVVAEVRSLVGNGVVQRSLDSVAAQVARLSNVTVRTQLQQTLEEISHHR